MKKLMQSKRGSALATTLLSMVVVFMLINVTVMIGYNAQMNAKRSENSFFNKYTLDVIAYRFINGIKEGNTLLMNAGASGLASVIIPMAKAFGVRVITTVLTDEIAEKIKHLGADRVVVTTKEDISLVLKEELEAGHSVDVAIDCLGGEIMGKCIHYLTHGARWIMIAALAGTKTEIDLKNIYVRNVRIIGSTLRSRTPAVKAQILAGIVRDVYPKIEAGLVKPTIHATLPITEAEAAHDILYKGQNVGKVVLTVE